MVAGPPCSNCGWTLRWVAEQNAWGCDRCRSVFPAQAQPQPAAPQPAPQQSTSWAKPHLGTTPGSAPAGGAFGGSAATAGRSNSAPPGVYSAGQSSFSVPVAANPQYAQQPPQAQPPYAQQPHAQQPQPYAQAQAQPPYAQPPQAYAQQPAQQAYAQQPAQQSYVAQPATQQRPGSQSGGSYGGASRPGSHVGLDGGGYPQNVYGRPGDAAAPSDPPKPKSRRGLLIAVGGLVAIGAGVGIAVGVSGGGKAKRGLESRDEVIAKTFTALTAGDVDALTALMGTDLMADTLECDATGKGAVEKGLTAQRDLTKQFAEKAKGLELELVKTVDDKKTVLAKTDAVKGCTFKVDVTSHEVAVMIKVKKGTVSKERGKAIQLTEIDGRWFLAFPPSIEAPGDCAAAAKTTAKNGDVYKKQGVGDSGLARIEKAFGQHCADDKWADSVTICFTDAKSDRDNGKCMEQLTQSQHDKLVGHLKQIVVEDLKSREVPVIKETPSVPVVEPAPGPGSGSGSSAPVVEDLPIPPICNDYKAEIEKLSKCRRIKADVRQGQMKRYELIVEGWNSARTRDKIRESTEKLCKAGADQVIDLRKSLCR